MNTLFCSVPVIDHRGSTGRFVAVKVVRVLARDDCQRAFT
jgi:hypothetical protein